ncbi:MAG: dephospho-CoA kinase [Acidimicrobiales bacterium]
MLVVGLTGSIGSGKTAVSNLLALLGAVIIDADLIARDVVSPGSLGLQKIVDHFGSSIIDSAGGLNRSLLADRVFMDPAELAALNSLVHPLVRDVIESRIASVEVDDPAARIVVVLPLLVESGHWKARFDKIIVVDTPDSVVIDRLVRFRGMEYADAVARLRSQASREERRAVADIVIENDGSEEELERRVREVWTCLTAGAP